ncbi:MAG: DNA methylase [Acidobacteriia bacterium]|nr:DNA methylase [Terriglobia bacterium]
MAQSPAHRFGQTIGEVLEAAVIPLLAAFATKHNLYLDKHGDRPCRPGKKCTWLDLNKNAHDLDFVLERGGTHEKLGIPAAFIETAWRRYTKHSRNKAQEIQGAIAPLSETYKNARPFIGVILAGVFTEGALTQLRSLGFSVLYFSYDSVIAAFKKYGIDASFDEDTRITEFRKKVKVYEALSAENRAKLSQSLLETQRADVDKFMAALGKVVLRQIERITVLPLHGTSVDLSTLVDAIKFIEAYKEDTFEQPISRYEIRIRYNNGDLIEGTFRDKADAIGFLRTYLPLLPTRK